MKTVLYSNFIKMLCIFLLTYYIFIKIVGYKQNDIYKTIFTILLSICLSIIYIILIQYIYPLATIIILFLVYTFILNNIAIKDKYNYNIVAYLISFIFAYINYIVSVIISGIALKTVLPDINYENPISILTIPIFAILLSYFIFKIKRFSNGFNFLKNTNINKDVVEVSIFFCGIIIFIFGLFQRTNNTMLNTLLLSGTVLIAISFQFWIRSQITKYYRKSMRDRTIEIQKTEIDEQLKIIQEI